MLDGAMSGPRPPELSLSARQRAILDRLARRATSPQRLVRRGHILLAAADGGNNDQIARQYGLDRETVQTWRTRRLGAGGRVGPAGTGGGAAPGPGQQDPGG